MNIFNFKFAFKIVDKVRFKFRIFLNNKPSKFSHIVLEIFKYRVNIGSKEHNNAKSDDIRYNEILEIEGSHKHNKLCGFKSSRKRLDKHIFFKNMILECIGESTF